MGEVLSGHMSATTVESRGGSIVRPLACGLLSALCCWVSILTREPGRMSTIWIASGVLAGLLLTSPRRIWPGCTVMALAGGLIVRALSGDAWYLVVGRGFAGIFDAVLVAWTLVHFAGEVTRPANIRRVARFAFGGTVVACTLSGAFAAGFQCVFDGSAFVPLFATWFASHTLGMVIFATLTVVATAQGTRLLGKQGHRVDLALCILLVGLVAILIFAQTRYPLLFLVYPPLLLAAFRHRFTGVVFGVTLVTVIAINGTLAGVGPFHLIPHSAQTERILLLQLFIASTCLLTLPVAVVLTNRGFLAHKLGDSERRYRILADYSRDLVMRIGADGHILYVSPSASDLLGWEMKGNAGSGLGLVHPDDVGQVAQSFQGLLAAGGATTITYRIRHRDGHYVWMEANAVRVPGLGPLEQPEVIYSGRDVTRRTEAEQALSQNQRQLRAITDNLPALVVRVGADLRYTFANARAGVVLGRDPAQIVGKPIREVLQPKYYDEIIAYAEAALRGQASDFGIEREFDGNRYFFQTTIVPDIEPDGSISGFYVMSSDVTQLKRTEEELRLLARFDSLTGLANRFHFNERSQQAIARRSRTQRPLALLYFDIDRFKQINDSKGHAVGDGVLREFAQRINSCLRVTDFAARLGGDEFVVLVEDADSIEAPEMIARKMIAAMRPAFVVDGVELRVTTSIGIGYCSGHIESREALLLSADRALYAAKAAGRDTYRSAVCGDQAEGEVA